MMQFVWTILILIVLRDSTEMLVIDNVISQLSNDTDVYRQEPIICIFVVIS